MTSPSASPQLYEIRIAGHLDARWAMRFNGMTLIAEQDGTTVVRGELVDQAALHGVLQRLRDASLPLIALSRLDTPPDTQRSAS